MTYLFAYTHTVVNTFLYTTPTLECILLDSRFAARLRPPWAHVSASPKFYFCYINRARTGYVRPFEAISFFVCHRYKDRSPFILALHLFLPFYRHIWTIKSSHNNCHELTIDCHHDSYNFITPYKLHYTN